MGLSDYISISWTTETPVSEGMSWGNVLILVSGAKPTECSTNPQLVTSTNYAQYIPSTSYEYIALGSYFKNFSGTPTNSTYMYYMGQGSGITGIMSGTGLAWEIPNGPFSSIDHIQIDPTGGSNWQEISGYTSGTLPSGYIASTGYGGGNYDGGITFTGALNQGGEDIGGPYFDSGGTTYSGQTARDIFHASGGIMRALATQNGFGLAQQQTKTYDIQFILPLYNVAGDGTGLESTPAFNDLRNALLMAASKRKMVVWALPKGASPHTTYGGTGYPYSQFRNFIGQDRNAIVTYMDVSTGTTSGTGVDDPAAALLGAICTSHPHTPLTLAPINISLASRPDDGELAAWNAGKIIVVTRMTDLGFSTDQLNYGFTFAGTSPSDRIENVRCKYLVEYNILVDLWMLLSTRTVRINKSGLNKIIDTINATLNRLESQGLIDSGERFVDIPLLRGTSTEWSNANLTRKVPSVIIRWPWKNSVEEIIITQFGEII